MPIRLSAQEILNCNGYGSGCKGGQPFDVFRYMVENCVIYDGYLPYKGIRK